ncbi:hypothetical protein DSO57_1002569 [Entomophthora muscae]|uniref:Uncharacterized protein n=1 Tax=Entomophthora muscae TaxID=34485 RepID=A0ACC2U6Y9_9FUNG|nr:hypothetical protein DSO57_1002569 [Entomophthora muscae]
MTYPVKLYVYDLSNGLAKSLSLSLTGKFMEGIWHTSVVVYGKEIYYGQGIYMVEPGSTHHGEPLKIVDLGSTSIPPEVFFEYLEELKNTYTQDKYHVIDFNCNNFSNEVVAFLNGSEIPSYIQSLPAEFMATPFGQMIRPKIDSFFGASRAQNPMPLNSFGTIDPAALLASLNVQPPVSQNPSTSHQTASPSKLEVLTPASLEALQKLIQSSEGLVVVVEKPDNKSENPTQARLCKMISEHGLEKVKIARVTSTRPPQRVQLEDQQTIVVQFFANGTEITRTCFLSTASLLTEFKTMMHFLCKSEKVMALKPLTSKVSLAIQKLPKFPHVNIEKGLFLNASSINAAELEDSWEQVSQSEVKNGSFGQLIPKLELLLSSTLSSLTEDNVIILDGVTHLMCHPCVSKQLCGSFKKASIIDALVKAFVDKDSPKKSLLNFALSLFSSADSSEFCTSVSYPLEASHSSPLLQLGEIVVLAFAEEGLSELAAKLAFNVTLNIVELNSNVNFFALEDGEIWAMEFYSAVINALVETKQPELVSLLTETVMLANMRLSLTPSNSIIVALTESVELHETLENKLKALEFSPKSAEFLKSSISYLKGLL